MSRGGTIPLLAAAALAALTGALAGCGSDGGERLSPSTATELTATLDRVEQDVNAGNCEAAATQTRALVERTGGLPGSIDSGLREALVDSADRLQVLVTQRCSSATTGPTGPSETTPETGSSGPTGKQKKQEKQQKPEKEKTKPPKHEQSGTTGEDQTGTTGGDGQDNQDSGGVAP